MERKVSWNTVLKLKGKLKYWKMLQKFSKSEDCFSQLGAEWDLSDFLSDKLAEYLCNLLHKNNINKGDGCSFKRNMQKKMKSLTCQLYHLSVMFSKYIRRKILWQKYGDLWKIKLMKWVPQITAGMNMEWHSVDWPSISWWY